jgi:hypothetical protein
VTTMCLLKPEVAGGWGPGTVVSNRAELATGKETVPKVTHLHYLFDGWLGDELITSHPCFLVTRQLGTAMREAGLNGLEFRTVRVSVSELFAEMEPDCILPEWLWLLPEGVVKLTEKGTIREWSGHDVCLTQRAQLVVSTRALQVLSHCIPHCEVTECPLHSEE